jgi:hypothetical protein
MDSAEFAASTMTPATTSHASKSLAELSGVDWGPPPRGASLLVQERHALRRKPIRDLYTEDLRRLLDIGCEEGFLVPVALERSKVGENVALLCALLRVRSYGWRSHAEQLQKLRDPVYHADNLFAQVENDPDTRS